MKKTFSSFLALILLSSLFALTAAANSEKEGRACHMKKHAPHIDYYYELLIEKHAPELAEQWSIVSEEKQQLFAQLKESDDKKEKFKEKLKKGDWHKRHRELEKQFKEAVKERNETEIKNMLPKMLELQKEIKSMLEDIVK